MTLIASKPRAGIAALQWAAGRAGQSYGVFTQRLTAEGVFTQRLTAEDEKRIQEEFEAWQRNGEDYEQEIRLD